MLSLLRAPTSWSNFAYSLVMPWVRKRLSARANQLEGLSLQKDGSLMSRKRSGASNWMRFSSYSAMTKIRKLDYL